MDRMIESGSSRLRTTPSRRRVNGSTSAEGSSGHLVDRRWRRPPGSRCGRGRRSRCAVSSLPASKPAFACPARWPVKRSSISKAAPWRPPRFIEPRTTLPSRAPSRSSRSSRMSAVASTPSTPGRESAAEALQQVGAVRHGHRVGRRRGRRGPGGRRPRSSVGRPRARRGRGCAPPRRGAAARAAAPGFGQGRRFDAVGHGPDLPLRRARSRPRRSWASRRSTPAGRRRCAPAALA